MRQLILAGILILGLGGLLLLRGGSTTIGRDVLKFGEIRITADEQQSVLRWGGAVVMIVGVALIIAGAQKRSLSRA